MRNDMVKKATKSAKIKDIGTCYECQYAYLMQSSKENPIVSECTFNHERQVARMHKCNIAMFKRNMNNSPNIHPMINASI